MKVSFPQTKDRMNIIFEKLAEEVIKKKYEELNLEPQERDYWVADTRNGNLVGPIVGCADALLHMNDLNGYVFRNTKQDLKPFIVLDLKGVRIDPGI